MVRMDKAGLRQLAVIDRKNGNKLVGILTMSDIVRAHAQAAVEVGDPDQTIFPESGVTRSFESQTERARRDCRWLDSKGYGEATNTRQLEVVMSPGDNLDEHQPDIQRVLTSKAETKAFYNKIARVYDLLSESSEEPGEVDNIFSGHRENTEGDEPSLKNLAAPG
jgi:hypothetical protein